MRPRPRGGETRKQRSPWQGLVPREAEAGAERGLLGSGSRQGRSNLPKVTCWEVKGWESHGGGMVVV